MLSLSTPLVSLIIPVFNTEKELVRCISSIERQSYQHLQVIIVNDGSTDQSAEKAQKFCEKDRRFFLHHKENGGLSDARNFGFQKAEGEFVAFIDSDDELRPKFVEKLLGCAQNLMTDVVICLAQVKEAKTGRDLYQTKGFAKIPQGQVFDYKDVADVLFQSSVAAWDKLYRTDFLRQNHLQFLKGRHFEDLPFFAEVMTKAKRVGQVLEPLYDYYLMRAGSLTERKSLEYLDIPVTLRHAQTFLQQEGSYTKVKASFLDYKWERMLSAYVMISEELKPKFSELMKKELALDSDDIKKMGKQIKFLG